MAYKECSQCEFMYPDESGKAACACMNHDDLPSFCPLRLPDESEAGSIHNFDSLYST